MLWVKLKIGEMSVESEIMNIDMTVDVNGSTGHIYEWVVQGN